MSLAKGFSSLFSLSMNQLLVSRMNEIIKIRAEINEIEVKKRKSKLDTLIVPTFHNDYNN